MSKYENWEFVLIRLSDEKSKNNTVQNYQSKESLYQEFKERLTDELHTEHGDKLVQSLLSRK